MLHATARTMGQREDNCRSLVSVTRKRKYFIVLIPQAFTNHLDIDDVRDASVSGGRNDDAEHVRLEHALLPLAIAALKFVVYASSYLSMLGTIVT